MGEYAAHEGTLDGTGLRCGIVVARFNRDITEQLLDGARRRLAERGVADGDVVVAWVPGAFELPLVAKQLASSGSFDAVICLGAVIRGETAHFEYVAGPTAEALQRAALDTGRPVVFGVLTTENREQALDRVGGKEGHKGEEAADTAVEVANLLRSLPRA